MHVAPRATGRIAKWVGSWCVLATAAACGRVGFGPHELPDAALTVDWTTPNSIRWTWTGADELEPIAYEFVLATTKDGLTGEGRTVITSAINPELGWLENDTITDQLTPATTYFGQLVAVLPNGARATSGVVSGSTTLELTSTMTLFEDAPTDGYSIPADFIHSAEGAQNGTHCYRFVAACDGEPNCFENLRRQDVSFDLEVIPPSAFDGALLEFSVAADGPLHSDYSHARLMMRDRSTDETTVYTAGGFSHRADGNYRTYQIPLTSLVADDVPLSPAVAASADLFEWGIGGQWSDGAVVRIDDVLIRY